MATRGSTLRRLAAIDRSFAYRESPSNWGFICKPCHLRLFATTPIAQAGHNKWSKTKHIKAATDKKKMADRTHFHKLISMYSRMYGEDVKFNPQLGNAIAAATKASVPKSVIESAIARGQGRSTTGAQLEPMTLEALMTPNIAIIVEAETDNKIRTISDLRNVVKKAGAVSSATAFYFTKRGRAVFKIQEGGLTLTDILDEAIEHEGVEDVEELPDGDIVAWTTPATLMAVTEAMSKKCNLEVLESDIVFAPNQDTMVDMETSDSALALNTLLTNIKEYPEVKAIYANVRQGSISDDEWEKIDGYLDI